MAGIKGDGHSLLSGVLLRPPPIAPWRPQIAISVNHGKPLRHNEDPDSMVAARFEETIGFPPTPSESLTSQICFTVMPRW